MPPLTLLLSDKPDPERDQVALAWEQRVGPVLRLARFWDPPALDPSTTRVYGADTFCLVLAEKIQLDLCSPDDDLLVHVQPEFLGRALEITTLQKVQSRALPRFVKPVIPKLFAAGVVTDWELLRERTFGLDGYTQVYGSDVVSIVAEARAFVLEGQVVSCAVYEGEADTQGATALVERVAASMRLPRTCVVDVGLLTNGTWCVVEFNATWGAGLNGCDPQRVIACIAAASGRFDSVVEDR